MIAPRLSFRRSAAFSGLAVLLMGCPSPEPEEKFDGFLDETKEARDEFQNTKMDMGSTLADVNGEFLFAIETIISPGLFIQFVATTELEVAADGSGGTMKLTFQPLSLDMGQNLVPREFVGDLIVADNIEVSPAGQFRVESLGEVFVSGAANPITGADIIADLGFEGFIQDDQVYCGAVFGTVIEPLSGVGLEGSTFGAQRLEATDPASLPTDILFKCPEAGAPPTGDTGAGDTAGSDGSGG
jgi:hypothetical protein